MRLSSQADGTSNSSRIKLAVIFKFETGSFLGDWITKNDESCRAGYLLSVLINF
jgi:hypothetical protein